jgi:serine/threonine protein kinase
MIKSIRNISSLTSIDQNELSNIHSVTEINYHEDEIGSGGFGSVHKVTSISKNEVNKYVLKIFKDEEHIDHAFETIKLLHEKLKKHQLKSHFPIFHEHSELLGLPFLAFKGYDIIEERHVTAFLMYNLDTLAYFDFGSDQFNRKEFQSIEIPDKVYLGYTLSKAIDFLHSINFLHSDLAEDSFWFSLELNKTALIDFDAGYHFDQQVKPITWSKPSQWAGLMWNKIVSTLNKDTVEVSLKDRLSEEYIRLAYSLFEIIIGVPPFSFLSGGDDNTKLSYLKENSWPDISSNSEYFNIGNQKQYEDLINMIRLFEENGLDEFVNAFRRVFNEGFKNERKRLSAKEWKELLFQICSAFELKPEITFFNSSKQSINSCEEEIIFSWEVKRADRIFLDGVLMDLDVKSYSKSFNDSEDVELRVENDFGHISEKIPVQAIKIDPKEILFHYDKEIRDSIDPIKLSWEYGNTKKVILENTGEEFKSTDQILLEPTQKTDYKFTVIGLFNQVLSKEISIDVISPEIKEFGFEINLNEGINNIDLSWKVLNAESIEISPKIGKRGIEGLEHVNIYEETKFKLVAKGIFIDKVQELVTHPFPVPIVKQIFVELPKFEDTVNINLEELKIPSELIETNKIEFNANLNLPSQLLNSNLLVKGIEAPRFTIKNELLDKYSKEQKSLGDIYSKVKDIIYKKLEDYENKRNNKNAI